MINATCSRMSSCTVGAAFVMSGINNPRENLFRSMLTGLPAQSVHSASSAFEDRRNALATPDAHRGEGIAAARPVQFINGLGGNDRPRRTYGVSEGNARTIRV